MSTFAEDGAKKVKVSPTGPTPASAALSVVPSVNSPRTTADQEVIALLTALNQKADLLIELLASKRL